ncbi:MAG: acyltransferase [Pedobacter sp.]
MPLVTTNAFHRLRFLDSLRALAALFVVIHHAAINYYEYVPKDPAGQAEFRFEGLKLVAFEFFRRGHFAVDLFIVLSGFSLMLSVLKTDYKLKGGAMVFFKRRIIRIIPTYYAAILLSMLLISTLIGDKTQTHWDISIPVDTFDIITHLLLVSDFFLSTAYSISHVFWSICVEFRIYLFFPIILSLWFKKGALTAISFSILISIIGLLVLGILKAFWSQDINTGQAGISPYIILFSLGMLAADLSVKAGKSQGSFRSLYKNKPLAILVPCVILSGVMLGSGGFLSKLESPGWLEYGVVYSHLKDIGIGILCSLFLFVVTLSATEEKKESALLATLNWKPLAFIGKFSYSLYLIHPVVLQVVSKFIVIPLHTDRFTSACILAAIGIISSLVISYIFFIFFERPFLNAGKKGSGKVIVKHATSDTAA